MSKSVEEIPAQLELSSEKPLKKKPAIDSKPKKLAWWIWLLAGLVGLMLVLGWQYHQFVQAADRRREGQRVQQEKMVKFWQDQGLSQTEIDTKLKADRQQNFRVNGEPDFYRTIMRTINHGIGGAPAGSGLGRDR